MARPDPVLAMLGMAARAGAVIPGTAAVRDAVRSGRARYVLVAADASANTRAKLVPLLEAKKVPYAERFERAELGTAVGQAGLGAVAVTTEPLASRVAALLEARRTGEAPG